MILLIIFIAFFIDLAFTDLIFRINFDKFVNLLIFKIMLIDSVWWWEQQKSEDFLLCFFVFVWVYLLDCNIIKIHWCLKCYMYRNHWQSYWILNKKCSRKNISLILLNDYNVIVVTLSLSCYLQSVTREKCCSKTQSCYDFDILRC